VFNGWRDDLAKHIEGGTAFTVSIDKGRGISTGISAYGVLALRGHTEAAVDLARLARLNASGVICEIVNSDGIMARLTDLIHFCATHQLAMVTVADLVQHRWELESDELWMHSEGS